MEFFVRTLVSILLPLLLPNNQVQEFQAPFFKQVVFKENVSLPYFVYFLKTIHVELANKTLDFLVAKVDRKDSILHFLLVFYLDLTTITRPTYNVHKLVILEYVVEFEDEVWDILLGRGEGIQVDTCHWILVGI